MFKCCITFPKIYHTLRILFCGRVGTVGLEYLLLDSSFQPRHNGRLQAAGEAFPIEEVALSPDRKLVRDSALGCRQAKQPTVFRPTTAQIKCPEN